MSEEEPLKRTTTLIRNPPFLLMISFEMFFIISFLLGALGIRGAGLADTPYWWASTIVKIALGILVYVLFIAERKYATGGVLLVLSSLVFSIVVYYTSRDFLLPIIGGIGMILLTANTLIMIRLFKKPRLRLIEEISQKNWQIGVVLTITMVVFVLVSNSSLGYTVLVIGWIGYCRLIFGKLPSERISSRKFFDDVKS